MSEAAPEGAAAEPVVEAAAEPAFAVDPQEWQQTQQTLEQLQQIVQPQPQWQQPQGPAVPDPFAEDYATQLDAYIEAKTAPMRDWQQQQELSAAQASAMGTLDSLAVSGGAFDRDMAWARANQLVLENGGDANKALEQAAADTRAYETRVREDAVKQYQEQLQNLGNAPRGMPVNGANGVQTVSTGGLGNKPGAVTAKFFGPQIG